METAKFTKDFANQFQDSDIPNIHFNTEFKKLPTWDSLTGMAVLAMITHEYHVDIPIEEFRNLKTVNEVFIYVCNKLTS
jgi:acyl carrier protein